MQLAFRSANACSPESVIKSMKTGIVSTMEQFGAYLMAFLEVDPHAGAHNISALVHKMIRS